MGGEAQKVPQTSINDNISTIPQLSETLLASMNK